MKPPTISFPSAKGPSVTPEAVTTLPEGFSLLPISRILALNVSFHALNAANISCICAGEGLVWLGAPRYMQRYFWVDIGFSCLVCALGGASSKRRTERGESDLKDIFFAATRLAQGRDVLDSTSGRRTDSDRQGMDDRHRALYHPSSAKGIDTMAFDEKLADRVRGILRERNDVVERKMFGGLAFLIRGNMSCGIVGTD